MSDTTIALIVGVAAAVLLFTELIPIAVTGIGVVVVLVLAGILSPAEAFASFSNSTVILLAGTFVIGGAVFHTGLARRASTFIVRAAGGSELGLTVGIMAATAALSSVLSNTGTTAVLLPVVLSLATSSSVRQKQLLLALAFSANVGGTLTLIGTTPNLIAKAALDDAGLNSFSFWEFSKIGIPLTAFCMLYMMTLGHRFVSSKPAAKSSSPVMQPSETGCQDSVAASQGKTVQRNTKMWITAGLLLGVMAVMATGWVPLSIVAVAGALAVVLTNCLSYEEAIRSINWTTIFLVAGMLTLATALEKTGTAMLIAGSVLDLVGNTVSPHLLVGLFFLLTWVLTQFMANTASAALLIPIGLSVARALGVDPRPILIAIAVAASCAFATPVATPPNTLVYSTGKLRFGDFLKVGLPLSILALVTCVVLIPVFWPFH